MSHDSYTNTQRKIAAVNRFISDGHVEKYTERHFSISTDDSLRSDSELGQIIAILDHPENA